MRPTGLSRSMAGSSSGTQWVQRPQGNQNCIFAITADEAQANPDTVSSIMLVFGTPAHVLFDSGSSRSFVSSSFALHANRDLTLLKNKLIVTTPLGEQILRTSVFRGCEILVKGIVLKANLIPLEMLDFDVILGMDWLSTIVPRWTASPKRLCLKNQDIQNLSLKVIEEFCLRCNLDNRS